MGFISADALQNLHKYAYKGVDKSPLSKYVLNPFWTWFVTLWPLWVAPNTITLSGLSIVFLNFATLLWYDPTYLADKGGVVMPNWVFDRSLLYQSFDAIDGRRTGMAGPLGEMFDHGCDAMNTTLEVIMASQALNLGRSWWTVASQIAYTRQFLSHYLGRVPYGVRFFFMLSIRLMSLQANYTSACSLVPLRAFLIIIAIYAISGVYGPSFWDTGMLTFCDSLTNLPDLPLNDAFMTTAAFGVAYNLQASYRNPLLLLLPFVVSSGSYNPHYNNSALINSALFVPFLSGGMILAHVTSTPFPVWDWMWVWEPRVRRRREPPAARRSVLDFSLLLLVLLASLTETPGLQLSRRAKRTARCSSTSRSRSPSARTGRFCTLVINDITNFMGIACFTVRKKDKNGNWQGKNYDIHDM
ncbi:hypothetical protein B0H14DRAFT_3117420 [Mycena olivaceomarginata]|nr:hypothetical protein B0H14DRAFT_3117420 [Mycena olivaceomarginata]